VLLNRVCMVRIKDERFRECRLCKVVAMFELLEDLLSISAIFVSSYIPNKTVSLRMFVAMLTL
jgi:hypothetical protein